MFTRGLSLREAVPEMNGLYNDTELKLIPYGLGSFKKLRGRDYAYV